VAYDYDPDLLPLIAYVPELDIADLGAARALLDSMRVARPAFVLPDSVVLGKRRVPGRAGDPDVDVWVFSPRARTGLAPGLLYLHGGGFVLGDAEGEALTPAQAAEQVGAVVVSVEYRLAPESPFPAAVEDCCAVLRWMAENAGELGIDPLRIAIGGQSAGAGLAAGVALLSRDRGGPRLCMQLLEIPVLDDRLDTPSMKTYTDTLLWNLPNAVKSWEYYLGPARDGLETSPYAAPARAGDLAGLPRAFVSVCEFDPLRDEGLQYAQRLVQAGVATELHLYPGTFHGSSGVAPQAATSLRMKRDWLDALRRGTAAVPTSS